jgi:hypothetical protein
MFKRLVSCQGYFANIVTTLLAVALAKAKQITTTDRVIVRSYLVTVPLFIFGFV